MNYYFIVLDIYISDSCRKLETRFLSPCVMYTYSVAFMNFVCVFFK